MTLTFEYYILGLPAGDISRELRVVGLTMDHGSLELWLSISRSITRIPLTQAAHPLAYLSDALIPSATGPTGEGALKARAPVVGSSRSSVGGRSISPLIIVAHVPTHAKIQW